MDGGEIKNWTLRVYASPHIRNWDAIEDANLQSAIHYVGRCSGGVVKTGTS